MRGSPPASCSTLAFLDNMTDSRITIVVLAAGLGWLLRAAALTLFGAGGNCDFGLARGVPDLRKG